MWRFLVLSAAPLLLSSACEKQPATNSPPAPLKTFEGRGLLRAWAGDGRHARISHEAIAGYMEAMTMEFEVRDEAARRERKAGDAIAFRLTIGDAGGWIDQVRPIDAVLTVPGVPKPPVATMPERLPDVALMDDAGREFRLSEHRGEALAITFIFTRCPFPTYCPLLNARFAAVQRELPAEGRWHLFSITLDPAYDTPERLAEYAKSYRHDERRWTFATGSTAGIRQLGAAVGLAVAEGAALPEHNLRTVVIDAEGRVKKLFMDNEWTPADLARAMQAAP